MSRTAEEWGRLAVAIPGWRGMPGMRDGRTGERYEDGDGPWIVNKWPDPDDPATEGCLLRLLGSRCLVRILPRDGRPLVEIVIPSGLTRDGRPHRVTGATLGRACIAAAAALGRWPGSGE